MNNDWSNLETDEIPLFFIEPKYADDASEELRQRTFLADLKWCGPVERTIHGVNPTNIWAHNDL
jgi:hypothetical protein